MLDVPYGQGKSLMHGAVYKYVYTINMFSNFYIYISTLIFTMFKEGACPTISLWRFEIGKLVS